MGSRSPNGHAALDKIRNYQATRFMVRVQFQPHRNRRLAMTVWGVLCMYLVGFKVRVPFQPHRNSQLAMTVWGALSMSLIGFMVRVQFQPHRNRRLAMTAWGVATFTSRPGLL